MLKRWRLKFDTASEYFSFQHLWILLPGLPLHFWNYRALQAIGNELGRFIKVDEKVLNSSDRCMAKILVEVDIHGGLLETIEIDWHVFIYKQRLDYLGVLFRCSFCR
jgi:hypothetical protein